MALLVAVVLRWQQAALTEVGRGVVCGKCACEGV